MQQVVAVFLVSSVLVGVLVGRKVEKARRSHGYYRRIRSSVPELRKTAWTDIRGAAGTVLVVGAILLFVAVVGLTG